LLWIFSHFWQENPQERFLQISKTAGNFPADFKNRSKQLPIKVLARNQNPQETFPADF
jgi:hypothetical protein